MLDKLLQLLKHGGARTTADLARELGVSQELTRAMLADLARRGYLQAVASECSGNCAGCARVDACSVSSAGQVWVAARRGSHQEDDTCPN